MKKQLKDVLHYYLGARLQLTCSGFFMPNREEKPLLKGASATLTANLFADIYDETFGVGVFKPHFRQLSSLTKPITVEGYNNGEPFVPLKIIRRIMPIKYENNCFYFHKECGCCFSDISIDLLAEHLPFNTLELLLKWQFNVFGLDESQYIEIKD